MLKYILAPVLLLLAIFAGYWGYRYLVRYPPIALLERLSHTSAPTQVPPGGAVPLIVPEGFQVTIYARDVPGVRVIMRDQDGTMLASLTREGKVVALPDDDRDGVADKAVSVLEGLRGPHGIAVWCSNLDSDRCLLFVAEEDALKSYTYDAKAMKATFVRRIADLPSGGGHETRSLLIEPDNEHMLVSIGSSCNVCDESNSARASVEEVDLHTYEVKPYARGLRNTVFMTINPGDSSIWGTDMGRDLLGDNVPPDEVNILRNGANYGWPICYGDNIHDTDFDHRQYIRDPCADAIKPTIKLQAHSAPLGIAFVPHSGYPSGWEGDILVALHGSWNRSEPVGYKVVRFDLDATGAQVGGPVDFLSGFLPSGGAGAGDSLGRPVGLLAEEGGVVYVSDDRAGAIYRIARIPS